MNNNFTNNTFYNISKKILIFFKIVLPIFMIFQSSIAFSNDFKIIARVDDKYITQYDLDNHLKILQIYLKNNKELDNNIKKEVLNSIIENILKEKAINNEKIVFDEEEFNYYLESLKKENNMDEQIKKQNIDINIYNNVLKNSYLWSKLVNEKIKPRINVTNSEVNEALEYLSENSIRTRYNISQIILYKNQTNDPKLIAEKLYKEINEKNNFDSIAERFSQDNKKNKGYIGWVDEMDINKPTYDAIKNLTIGSTSKPIYFGDVNSGYYILIKLNDKKQERIAKKDDIARVQYFIYNQKLELEVKNYMDNIYNNSLIEIYN